MDEVKDVDLIFIGGPIAETRCARYRRFTTLRSGSAGRRTEQTPSRTCVPEGRADLLSRFPSPKQFDYAVVASTTPFSTRRRAVTLAGSPDTGPRVQRNLSPRKIVSRSCSPIVR